MEKASTKRGNSLSEVRVHEVIEVRHLTDTAYVLRMTKGSMDFIPGQYISIGKVASIDKRDYSIYSSPNDEYLEVLIKEVADGMVSKSLRNMKPGEPIEVEGPFGFFQLKPDTLNERKHLFIASGTGISPFHSMVTSFPELNYHLIHGVRYGADAYEKSMYQSNRITVCSSRDGKGDYYGRVTDWLKENPIDQSTYCYLCGNSDMINDAFDILEAQGVPSEHIHAEVYF